MSLDIDLIETRPTEVYSANITHNLGAMASWAGFYKALWHPEELHIETAEQLLPYLEKGLAKMKSDPINAKTFDAGNGWGTYKVFVPWVEDLIAACKENPKAKIRVSR